MTLHERVEKDFKEAFSSQSEKLEVLRMLRAALHNREIEKKGKEGSEKLTEEDILEVIHREIKKRKEASELFTKGGRAELAEKERRESAILEPYLPAQMGENEIRAAAQKIVGGLDSKEFGKAMGAVMKELKGKADAQLVTSILKGELSKN